MEDVRRIPALERDNFRVDSSGWIEKRDPKGVRHLESPCGDMWELASGIHAGQQHFSYYAAVRETSKVGKRIPAMSDWFEIFQSMDASLLEGHPDWQSNSNVRDSLGLGLCGEKVPPRGKYFGIGSNGLYWASVKCKSGIATVNPPILSLSSNKVCFSGSSYRAFGLSVRCLSGGRSIPHFQMGDFFKNSAMSEAIHGITDSNALNVRAQCCSILKISGCLRNMDQFLTSLFERADELDAAYRTLNAEIGPNLPSFDQSRERERLSDAIISIHLRITSVLESPSKGNGF